MNNWVYLALALLIGFSMNFMNAAAKASKSELSYEDFKASVDFEDTTTEKRHPKTFGLSQTMKKNRQAGLELLHNVDQENISPLKNAFAQHQSQLLSELSSCFKTEGRLILVGSGTSGRIALQLEAEWRQYWQKQSSEQNPFHYENAVCAVIAGGPRAFVRAKEGFEDSVSSGKEAIKNLKVTPKDIVVLISASGSAKFNIGAGIEARNSHCQTYYFYNSETPSKMTKTLFEDYQVQHIRLVTGPQSITGSTRLQAGTMGLAFWGHLLNQVALNITDADSIEDAATTFTDQVAVLHSTLRNFLPTVSTIIQLEKDVLSDENADFYKTKATNQKGYITFIAPPKTLPTVKIDATETAPTFSTNPPRSVKDKAKQLKEAEFRAYMLGSSTNKKAWQDLLGRSLNSVEAIDAEEILLSSQADGDYGAFKDRPKGLGNLVIGVAKSRLTPEHASEMITILSDAKAKGAQTAFIGVLEEDSIDDHVTALKALTHAQLIIPYKVENDPLNILSTILLKQCLNLISNGTMIEMGKVYDNLMIDVSPSNDKLIDRVIRLVQTIHSMHHDESTKLDEKDLYHMVLETKKLKKSFEEDQGISTPPIVKTILTMIEKSVDFVTAITLLQENDQDFETLLYSQK